MVSNSDPKRSRGRQLGYTVLTPAQNGILRSAVRKFVDHHAELFGVHSNTIRRAMGKSGELDRENDPNVLPAEGT